MNALHGFCLPLRRKKRGCSRSPRQAPQSLAPSASPGGPWARFRRSFKEKKGRQVLRGVQGMSCAAGARSGSGEGGGTPPGTAPWGRVGCVPALSRGDLQPPRRLSRPAGACSLTGLGACSGLVGTGGGEFFLRPGLAPVRGPRRGILAGTWGFCTRCLPAVVETVW